MESRYGIAVYTTPKKGMGFALTDHTSERIQNGFGTKGIGASSLDRQWSGARIRKQLRDNFQTAPKRYRNLKGTEKTLTGELAFFKTISPVDFHQVFEKANLALHQNRDSFLVLDTKGKNVYSQKDLKQVDLKKTGKTTELNDPATSGLFGRIAEETLAHYKREVSPSLKKSVFLEHVAVRKTYLEQVANSGTFQRYDPLFSEVDRGQLGTFLSDSFTRSLNETGALKAGEEHGERTDLKILEDFAADQDLDSGRLSDLFGLNTYREHYTHSAAARNTLALIRTLSGSRDERISPNLVFQYTRYFDRENLKPGTAKEVDRITSDAYVRSKLYEIQKSFRSTEELLKEFNASGISLNHSMDTGHIHATVTGHEHETKLSQLKGMFDSALLESQNPTASLDDIAFNNAIRSENFGWAFSLYDRGKISKDLIEAYREYGPFTRLEKEKTFGERFREELSGFRKENGFLYDSELKESLKREPDSFIARLEPALDDVTRPVLSEAMTEGARQISL